MSQFWLEWLPQEAPPAAEDIITVPLLEQLAPKYHMTDPMDEGLVGEWRFDRNTGLMMPDYSGFNRHGINETAVWTATPYALAKVYDEETTVITDYKGITGTNAHTSELFFRTGSNATMGLYWWGETPAGPAGSGFNVSIETGNIWVRTYAGRVASWVGTWDDDVFHHLIVTFPTGGSLSDVVVYVAGALEGRDTLGNDGVLNLTADADLTIGVSLLALGLQGEIALFRISNRDLTPNEVAARYQIVTARASGVAHNWLVTFEEEDAGTSYFRTLTDNIGVIDSLSKIGTFFIRPDSDQVIGQWTDELDGTTDIYQSIDEPAPPVDSDYIQSPFAPQTQSYTCTLSDALDPGVDTGHTLSYRYRKFPVTNQQVDLTVTFLQGAVELTSWQHNNVASGWVTANQLIPSGIVGNITDYTDLRLEFGADIV